MADKKEVSDKIIIPDFSSPKYILPQIRSEIDEQKRPLSQIASWIDRAKEQGNLTVIGMNQIVEKTILDEDVFLTQGLNGCVALLNIDDEGKARFEHIDAPKFLKRKREMIDYVERGRVILLKPNIPELAEITGKNVFEYNFNLNSTPDSFTEVMAIQDSPYIQSVCFHVKKKESDFEIYLNAFERTQNARWQVDYIPNQIAKRIII